eukprot:CAMPEP_0195536642 /NCGR_PEP_ID=MMETSP0794_2-20130614/46471_1 /TAXON_ID=515487 /ORGANISM="Stephanopyxis turris, Strain CCMP 815" /LENGTH=63 /DNA_ID=CAMNT_0040670129 /DNA_START=291 /DNA_END=482 /DNA_ORIENTATION=+
MFNAEDSNPERPIMTNGWMGTGWERGSVSNPGATKDAMDETKKLDLRSATGMTGKFGRISAEL